MMLASSANNQIAVPATSHPRRPPAHRSVSLRHEGHGFDAPRSEPQRSRGRNAPSGALFVGQLSDESNRPGESAVPTLQKWFDLSNERPQFFEDNDPPYFLPHDSSSTSNATPGLTPQLGRIRPEVAHANTIGSSADDFRSVIDDLTIENKKLRERLRKYEKANHSHLEKDKLFEVKIHALPPKKRRELEEVLRQFAAGIEGSTDGGSSKVPGTGMLPYLSFNPPNISAAKLSSSSSTSNSRPVDSAYVSGSLSGPTSTSTLNKVGLEGKLRPQKRFGKEQKVESFLHNIPEGLLPKYSPVMTDKQKKKMVVQRLEQLFTGNKGQAMGNRHHPLQQQEVSELAAKADRASDDHAALIEGLREAHIRPYARDGDSARPGQLAAESSHETQNSRYNSESEDNFPDHSASPEQRPTRPLDLDPDRAQIPADNVEYIRHLGLSTPQLASDDSNEETDAEGWIYLNLLINMAQLDRKSVV